MMFEKINIKNIHIEIKEGRLSFKCSINDEKQLNIVAGKIAREVASQIGDWSLSGRVLTLLLAENASKKDINFGYIQKAFEIMIA